jgi:aminocarboxymuconate-semialdehyde decarboxylase
LYFDTLVFDTPTLQHLVQVFGSTQLILGTDYPFNFHDHTPVQRLLDAGLDADTVQRLSHINARTFLGMPL